MIFIPVSMIALENATPREIGLYTVRDVGRSKGFRFRGREVVG